jgi:hypothetical protein
MSRGLVLLDLVLLAAAAYFGAQVFDLWTTPLPRDTAPPPTSVGSPAALAAAAVPGGSRPAEGTGRSRSPGVVYATIADKNLFSPTRTERGPEPTPPVTPGRVMPTPAPPPPPPPPPKPFLNGVVILETGAIAYIEDPTTKKVVAYRVGDTVAGGTIESIAPDHVVLNRPSGRLEVRLRDPGKPRQVVTPQIPGQPRREPGVAPRQIQPAPPGQPPGQLPTSPRPFPPNLLRRVPPPPSGDAPSQ